MALSVWYFCHATEHGRQLRRQLTNERTPEPEIIHMWHTPQSITAGRGEGTAPPISPVRTDKVAENAI